METKQKQMVAEGEAMRGWEFSKNKKTGDGGGNYDATGGGPHGVKHNSGP